MPILCKRWLALSNPGTCCIWACMTPPRGKQVLDDVAQVADVVGLGIAEQLPWDALALQSMLARHRTARRLLAAGVDPSLRRRELRCIEGEEFEIGSKWSPMVTQIAVS